MKQSDDENTITLDDGKILKAVNFFSVNGCGGCYFEPYSFDDFCKKLKCCGYNRKDRISVVFQEVKK